MTNQADVLVIGAGPGGSLAAKTAAEKGLKTIVFERGARPGDKAASGCGLPPRMWREFPFMKELYIPSYKIKYQTLRMLDENLNERFTMRWSPSDLGEYSEAQEYFQINMYRPGLDQFLAQLAVNAGAELRTSTLVTDVIKDASGNVIGVITDKGEKIEGAVTIAADGAVSKIANQSGLREKWQPNEVTLVVDCDFNAPEERIDEIIGPEEYSNFVYVSPRYPATYVALMPGGFHIGFGQWIGRYMDAATQTPNEYLEQVIQSKPLQQFIQKLHAKPREFHAHLLLWLPHAPTNTYGNGIMLVGDAAGFPCPLEAEGINYAMVSGKLAAETAVEAIAAGNTSASGLQPYEAKWQASTIGEEFTSSKEWADLWAGIFFDPPQWKTLTPIANNLMFWASWSAPHITNFKRELARYGQDLPFLMEFAKTYLVPLMQKANVPLGRTMLKLAWQWLKTKKRPTLTEEKY